jgi:hypothetical protein
LLTPIVAEPDLEYGRPRLVESASQQAAYNVLGSLLKNISTLGYKVVAHNRTISKVDRFLENEAKGISELCTGSAFKSLSVLKIIRHRKDDRGRMVDRGALQKAQETS